MNNEEKLKALSEVITGRYSYLMNVMKSMDSLLQSAYTRNYWQGKGYAIGTTNNIDPNVIKGFQEEISGYTGEIQSLSKMLKILE